MGQFIDGPQDRKFAVRSAVHSTLWSAGQRLHTPGVTPAEVHTASHPMHEWWKEYDTASNYSLVWQVSFSYTSSASDCTIHVIVRSFRKTLSSSFVSRARAIKVHC